MLPPLARLKVALNGGRTSDAHPAVPCTPAEVATAAQGAVAAGAEAIHVHPRDAGGSETLDVGAAVAAIRTTCPATPVGVSTGLWITGGDVGARLRAVTAWADLPPRSRPDFASVNVAEPGFTDLVEVLRGLGVAVEAGVWSVDDAAALAIAPPVPRVLIEIMKPDTDPVAILAKLDETGTGGQRLLHGEDDMCWPMIALAGRLGLPTRIGLEDTLTGPGDEPVTDNAALVRLALAVWSG